MARYRNKKNNSRGKADGKPREETGAKTSSESKSNEGPKEGSGKEGENSREDGKIKSSPINDPSWYTKFPELAQGAGNIPFSDPLGSPVKYGEIYSETITVGGQRKLVTYDPSEAVPLSVPGICSLMTKPSYGYAVNRNHALNIAAQQLYSNVRYVNSGRKNYDAPDLTIYVATIAELYSIVNWLIRLYGYAFMYSQRNMYIGKALIEANHVNARDIVNNLANFRYMINMYISKISSFAVPADINIFKRRAYMFQSLYTESTTQNIKDQLYQFIPDGFYKFALDETGKGMLKYSNICDFFNWNRQGSYYLTMNQISQYMESLLENIVGDEDFGLMTGDIIKAYGSNILGLNPIPEALIILPVYEEFTLSQMRNATIIDVARGTGIGNPRKPMYVKTSRGNEVVYSGDVYQTTDGNLVSVECMDSLAMNSARMITMLPGIITVTNPNPGIDDVFESTRLKTCIMETGEIELYADTPIVTITNGSDVVVACEFYSYRESESQNPAVWMGHINKWLSNGIEDTATILSEWEREHFHWSPLFYAVHVDADAAKVTRIELLSNVDNYTQLSTDNIRRLHEVAMLSLLSVPGVATIVG